MGLSINQEPAAQPTAGAKVQRCEKVRRDGYQGLNELPSGTALKKEQGGEWGQDRHPKQKVIFGIWKDICMKNVELFLLVMGSHCSIFLFSLEGDQTIYSPFLKPLY